MTYQGNVEIIDNWRATHSIEDLQRIVEQKGYSAISVGSFDHAALKKFPYQLTAGHCEPSPGYSNTFYIWGGRGGGSGALGIISSVQPADADEDEDEDEDWDEGGGACMAWGYQSEDQLACYGSVSGMTYDLDHPCWHELDANPTCCNYCGPWTSSKYESTCSALDIIRVSAGCCFSVQDSSGTEHHYDQDQNFCYNGVGCDSVRSVKVYDCSGGDEDEEPGEGSGGSLGKVEVGRVMSWYDYRARAKQEGGRLPTTAELRVAGVDVGYDQWTPITPSPGDQETGRRDGARGKDENAWANIGPRKYQIEYPAWGLDASEHPWKRLTYFYVVSESGPPLDYHHNAGWCWGPGTPDDCTVADVACPLGETEAVAADCWAICAAKYPTELVAVDIDQYDATAAGMCDCCCQTECSCLQGVGWESLAVSAGYALPGSCDGGAPPRIIDSRLVLVRRGSPNVLRFDHWQALQAGGAAPLTCHASHPGNGIGKMYPEERRFEEWRYTESKCVAARDACSVQLVQGKFLKRVDANLVLDVAFWKFHEGTAVNWVGGGSDDRTYLHGGGRDFRVNSDGSICLVNHPHLCLGVIDSESQADLTDAAAWDDDDDLDDILNS